VQGRDLTPAGTRRGRRDERRDRGLGTPRQDALAACADAIEALKSRVPLWKKELYADGEEWIGRGS
jgi:hypothetical protein